MPHFALVTTDGDALGTVELGRPDWPDGAIIYRAEKPNLSTDDLPLDKGVTDSVNELFDWLLVVSRRYLRAHFASLGITTTRTGHTALRSSRRRPRAAASSRWSAPSLAPKRRDRRGGLIHEYSNAA